MLMAAVLSSADVDANVGPYASTARPRQDGTRGFDLLRRRFAAVAFRPASLLAVILVLSTLSVPVAWSATNVALASNGGVASASGIYSASYPAAAVNDGDRAGLSANGGSIWLDGTYNVFPDWVQIVFNGSKTIDHVVVYTMQDNYETPVEPTDTMTFTLRGLTDFTVQGWNGTIWVILATVSGNNLVKRTVSFTAFTTNQIRINVTGALYGLARIIEIEAWTASARTSQTITFNALSDKAFGTAPFAVGATASSGLLVSFSSLTASICTVSGNMVSLVASGTCTIRASQAGDTTYTAAPNVDQSFSVTVAQTIRYMYDAAGNLSGIQRSHP
jgi:hypothetical protein